MRCARLLVLATVFILCWVKESQGLDPPFGWTCADSQYDDGKTCDCGCGRSDPDCNDGSAPIKCHDLSGNERMGKSAEFCDQSTDSCFEIPVGVIVGASIGGLVALICCCGLCCVGGYFAYKSLDSSNPHTPASYPAAGTGGNDIFNRVQLGLSSMFGGSQTQTGPLNAAGQTPINPINLNGQYGQYPQQPVQTTTQMMYPQAQQQNDADLPIAVAVPDYQPHNSYASYSK